VIGWSARFLCDLFLNWLRFGSFCFSPLLKNRNPAPEDVRRLIVRQGCVAPFFGEAPHTASGGVKQPRSDKVQARPGHLVTKPRLPGWRQLILESVRHIEVGRDLLYHFVWRT